ncbi:phosphotriesterase-related protein [Murinocardiopsis flavida]|uniref:Phosphotriesterase-related protein n=1 Tax=Murinocardiopsis flavida TaxID=645275 RepID=A0A2P8DH61_9ACTN|nr:aryldialkylphosphatase [Murinocardiopsis flavida]PSK96557.1 phosphotriesterase-related protein [Murinocardiopsis flavida]
MTGIIRTVLGDIPPERLGRTDYHEHLFQSTPLLPGEELDDEAASTTEARALHAAGIDAMVEATPVGLGRDPGGVARVAAATGMHIVLTTGAHREAHYLLGDPLIDDSADTLGRRFTGDLTTAAADPSDAVPAPPGPHGAPVRAGLLKAGIGYWSISAFERRVLAGVGAAHRATGAPVMVHLEHGSAALEVLDVLGGEGVPASAVALAHLDRNPDPGLHAEVCGRGAYVGYDGMARHRTHPDSVLLDCLRGTVERAGADQVLIGGDVARRSRYRAYGGLPGLDYLPLRFLPRVTAEVGADVATAALVANPARWLTWDAAASGAA